MNGDLGTPEALAIFGGVSVFIIVVFTIIFVVWAAIMALYIIGLWKTFKKAGEEGWKALIPVYNYVVLSNIVGITPWWLLIIAICYALAAVPIVNIIASFLAVAAYYYYSIILGIATARSFGKNDAWAVGFVLMPWLFYFIVGANKDDKYLGVMYNKDPVWDWMVNTFGIKDNRVKVTESETKVGNSKFCPKCGAKIDKDSNFCFSCGKKTND